MINSLVMVGHAVVWLAVFRTCLYYDWWAWINQYSFTRFIGTHVAPILTVAVIVTLIVFIAKGWEQSKPVWNNVTLTALTLCMAIPDVGIYCSLFGLAFFAVILLHRIKASEDKQLI
jgi:TRAP-type C4-dicarboxylate transport system permease small subunit